jgi:hypothetical protein
MPAGVKPFDLSFFIGLFFVLASLAVAAAAVGGRALPLVGTGHGALIAVAVIGMTGCAVAGISQTATFGWTNPVMILGSVLGVVALAVIAAGFFGWDGVLRPMASVVPGGVLAAATTEQLALVALSGMIALKFLINLGFALVRQGRLTT